MKKLGCCHLPREQWKKFRLQIQCSTIFGTLQSFDSSYDNSIDETGKWKHTLWRGWCRTGRGCPEPPQISPKPRCNWTLASPVQLVFRNNVKTLTFHILKIKEFKLYKLENYISLPLFICIAEELKCISIFKFFQVTLYTY